MSEFESMVVETLNAYGEQLNAIQTLLTALVGDCEAMKILEAKRAKDAKRQEKCRENKKCHVTSGKEKTNEEKEDIPPTPPIGEKEEKRKEPHTARAREESVDSSGQTYFAGIISEEEAKRIEAERQAEIKRQEREIFNSEAEKYFAAWWKLYPKKEGKGSAREKLLKLLKVKFKKGGMKAVDEFMGVIFKATHTWLGSELWNHDGKTFICHPTTWLNQERYLDDPVKYTPRTSRFERKTENQNCIVDYSDRPI